MQGRDPGKCVHAHDNADRLISAPRTSTFSDLSLRSGHEQADDKFRTDKFVQYPHGL